jgi:Fe-S cluster assembly iron-binding protein IscA
LYFADDLIKATVDRAAELAIQGISIDYQEARRSMIPIESTRQKARLEKR